MKRILTHSAIMAAVMITAAIITSCSGRTMNNMEPSGDTVEVDVVLNQQPDTELNISDTDGETVVI